MKKMQKTRPVIKRTEKRFFISFELKNKRLSTDQVKTIIEPKLAAWLIKKEIISSKSDIKNRTLVNHNDHQDMPTFVIITLSVTSSFNTLVIKAQLGLALKAQFSTDIDNLEIERQ